MNSRDSIKLAIDMGDMISMSYLQDLTDEQLMQRPHPECNHLKWQIGHLIASERTLPLKAVFTTSEPLLGDHREVLERAWLSQRFAEERDAWSEEGQRLSKEVVEMRRASELKGAEYLQACLELNEPRQKWLGELLDPRSP